MLGYMANPDLGAEHVKEIKKKNEEAVDKDGRTALDFAKHFRHDAVARELLGNNIGMGDAAAAEPERRAQPERPPQHRLSPRTAAIRCRRFLRRLR